MDEKILIKSEMDKEAKNICLALMGILFFISIALFIALATEWEYQEYWYGYYKTETDLGYSLAFSGYNGSGGALTCFIIACATFLFGAIISIVYLVHRACEITVTEKNVRGKAIFGKEVVLPIYMVSAYSTRSFLSTIAVATSSGLTKFALIENYVEIGNVLSKMINERQDSTAKSEPTVEAKTSNMDDILKLKNLLDQGIITQEEFDAKKKQLLGL